MKRPSFLSSLTQTYSAQVIVLVSGIILLKLLALHLSKEDFGAYLVVKRIAGIGYPLLSLNLGVSLARYIPLAAEKADHFFRLSRIILSATALVTAVMLLIDPVLSSKLIFGTGDYTFLVLPTLFFLYASAFQVLTLGYFRGIMDFSRMNAVNALFAVGSLLALLSFYISRDLHILALYFYVYSLGSVALNLIFFFSRKNSLRSKSSSMAEKALSKAFIKYGAKRIPSVFFIVAVFSLPVLYASNQLDLVAAAYIGIVVSIAGIFQTAGLPFNLLILPKTADLSAGKNLEEIRSIARTINDFFFTLPLMTLPWLVLFSRDLIVLWFGETYLPALPMLLIFSPAAAFILIYALLRGIIDGFEDYPYINIITGVSFAVLLLFMLLVIPAADTLQALALSFSLSLISLGILSMAVVRRQLRVAVFSRRNLISLTANLAFTALAAFTIYLSPFLTAGFYLLLTVKFFIALIISLVLLKLFSVLDYHWIASLRKQRGLRWL